MYIHKLQIKHVRNLANISISDLALTNLFVGDNGAGKSSVLEAIHIASVGRSFRHQQIKPVLQLDQNFLRVYLECIDDGDYAHKVGIERNHKNDYKVRIDGEKVSNLAALSLLLPCIVIDANSFNLLDGSASERRKFLDWGVFHVEHGFHLHWRNYSKVLKHRGVLLRSPKTNYAELKIWDLQLVEHAAYIEEARRKHLQQFYPIFLDILAQFDSSLSQSLGLKYKNGWGDTLAIDTLPVFSHNETKARMLEQLEANFIRDKKYQRTLEGSHRADILLTQQKLLAKDVYSRGQKKTLVAALQLSQAKMLAQLSERKPVVLLDDMPSELDKEHLKAFFSYLEQCDYQQFITAVDRQAFSDIPLKELKMFHVEQGEIKPING